MKTVLVVDDDEHTRRVLAIALERMGLGCCAVDRARTALTEIRREKAALILTDLKMPEMDGVEFMSELRNLDAEVPVIVLTAYGSVESAVEMMKLGALDYVAKPLDMEALEALIRRALELSRYRVERQFLRDAVPSATAQDTFVTRSEAMRAVKDLVQKVAPTRSPVLITGETGVGKEVVARAIHQGSPRHKGLFVPLNCAAVPAELLESELFGHVRGAFSGAQADRAGKFQVADGGTLFLDEIGEMDHRLQAKLLRVLEEGVVEPVGSDRRVRVDVRIISSTNRNLEEEIRGGRFREDLFYRLNVLRIDVPPLYERQEDLPELAATFLAEFGAQLGKRHLSLDDSCLSLLRLYPWRGNVRELRNIMERAAVLVSSDRVDAALLRSLLRASPSDQPFDLNLASRLQEVERDMIDRALTATDGSKAAAAALLGIGERTLWTKLKQLRR